MFLVEGAIGSKYLNYFFRAQLQAVEMNEKIETVNRERKYHQVRERTLLSIYIPKLADLMITR